MILDEQCLKNFQKCESDIDNDEHNTLLTCSPMFVYLVLYIVLNTKYINELFPVIFVQGLPAYLCKLYTCICIHIDNYANMILCATDHLSCMTTFAGLEGVAQDRF